MARGWQEIPLWETFTPEVAPPSFPRREGVLGEYLRHLEESSPASSLCLSSRYLKKTVAHFLQRRDPHERRKFLMADFLLRSTHRHLHETIYDPACEYGTLLLSGYRHKEAEDPTLKPSEIYALLNGSPSTSGDFRSSVRRKMELTGLRLRLKGWQEGHSLPVLSSLSNPPYDIVSSLTLFTHPLSLLRKLETISSPHCRYALLISEDALNQPSFQQELLNHFVLHQVVYFCEPYFRAQPVGVVMERAGGKSRPPLLESHAVQFITMKKSLEALFSPPCETWEKESERVKEVDYFIRRLALKQEFFENEEFRVYCVPQKKLQSRGLLGQDASSEPWQFYLKASSLALQMWSTGSNSLAPLSSWGTVHPLSEISSLPPHGIVIHSEGRFYPILSGENEPAPMGGTPKRAPDPIPDGWGPEDAFALVFKDRRQNMTFLCHLWNALPSRYLFLQQKRAQGGRKKEKKIGQIHMIHPDYLERSIREQLKEVWAHSPPPSEGWASEDLEVYEETSLKRADPDVILMTEVFHRSPDDLYEMRADLTRFKPEHPRKPPREGKRLPLHSSGGDTGLLFPLPP